MANALRVLFGALLSACPLLECASNAENPPALRNGHRRRPAGITSAAAATSVWAEALLTDHDRRAVATLNQRKDEVGQQNIYDRLQVTVVIMFIFILFPYDNRYFKGYLYTNLRYVSFY